eukprot:113956-Chlamydomonas_euryale.AAC.1
MQLRKTVSAAGKGGVCLGGAMHALEPAGCAPCRPASARRAAADMLHPGRSHCVVQLHGLLLAAYHWSVARLPSVCACRRRRTSRPHCCDTAMRRSARHTQRMAASSRRRTHARLPPRSRWPRHSASAQT